MNQKVTKNIIFFLFLMPLILVATEDSTKKNPTYDPRAKVCTIIGKHVEGTGIGYSQGYTTLNGFLSFPRCFQTWNPYIDLRGHVFNNGKWASNVGLGIRYIDSIAWGANIYYDYRNTTNYHYHQMGIGVEATGSFWNITING